MPRRPRQPKPPDPQRAVRYFVGGRPSGPVAQLEGYVLVATVHERQAEAARPVEERDGFLEAVSALVREHAGTLLVHAPGVLGDPTHRAIAEALVRMHEARIVFEADEDPPEVTLSFAALMDTLLTFEALARGARIKVGLEARRLQERAPGGDAPYGFRREGGRLVPDRAEQEVVAKVVALRGQGATFQAISDALLADGHTPRRGGRWAPQTLSNIVARGGATVSSGGDGQR